MEQSARERSKRIAKNTAVLYMRMLFLMLIGLYTSRVILDSLGVEDYGIYNVVGGFVGMFEILSVSMSSACSRFLNVELVKNDRERLSRVFSLTVTIMISISVIVFIVCEIAGIWYVRDVLVVDESRRRVAGWVFQFSLLSFCSKLVTVPYNSAIIAHERMNVFAFISIYEGIAKLAISFLVVIASMDKLIFYSMMICLLQMSVRWMYRIYCRRHYNECQYHFVYDKQLVKQLLSFVGWTFAGNSSTVLSTHGTNVMINSFFGPAMNTANGIAQQVQNTLNHFSNNFMMSLRPQIFQNYASGHYDYLRSLVQKGALYSYYMMLFVSLPLLMCTDFVMDIWLKDVPANAVRFVQLSLVLNIIRVISNPLITAQRATGNVRNFEIVTGLIKILILPICFILFKYGIVAEAFLIVTIVCEIGCLIVRMNMVSRSIQLSMEDFCVEVIWKIICVTLVSVIVPLVLKISMPVSITSELCVMFASAVFSAAAIVLVGLDRDERQFLRNAAVKSLKSSLHLGEKS